MTVFIAHVILMVINLKTGKPLFRQTVFSFPHRPQIFDHLLQDNFIESDTGNAADDDFQCNTDNDSPQLIFNLNIFFNQTYDMLNF